MNDAPAIDSILWNNAFSGVNIGITLSRLSDAPAAGRVVIIENAFAMTRTEPGHAIGVGGSGGQQDFGDVIIRKNIIAADPEGTGIHAFMAGILVTNAGNAIVENNVIDDVQSAFALTYENCTAFKAFNNQRGDGTLLRAYNIGTSRYLMELQDFTEDALIGF